MADIVQFTREAPQLDPLSFMKSSRTTCIIDGIRVYLDIEAVNTGLETTEAGPGFTSFQTGKLFMFVYNIASRASFETMQRLSYRLVYYHGFDDELPRIVVALPSGDERPRQVSYAEGQLLANRSCCDFLEATNTREHPFHAAIHQLVRYQWAFEAKEARRPKLVKSLGSKLLGERNARRLRLLRADRPLSAIQES
jgi:hypothetical protein